MADLTPPSDARTQRERMLAGELYIADDPELSREHLRAMVLMKRFNGSSAADPDLPSSAPPRPSRSRRSARTRRSSSRTLPGYVFPNVDWALYPCCRKRGKHLLAFENERAGRGEHDLPSHVEGQLALQYKVALVLAGVGVRRDHLAWREACLGDCKRAAEILRYHLVGYVQEGEVETFVRTDEVFLLLVGSYGALPSSSGT